MNFKLDTKRSIYDLRELTNVVLFSFSLSNVIAPSCASTIRLTSSRFCVRLLILHLIVQLIHSRVAQRVFENIVHHVFAMCQLAFLRVELDFGRVPLIK